MIEIQATNLHRAVACNGSLSLAAQLDVAASDDQSTEDAREGIAAHGVFAATLYGHVASPLEYIDKTTPNGIVVTSDMAEHIMSITDVITARLKHYERSEILIETNVDYEPTPGVIIRSRADCITWHAESGTLDIDDFKYGFRLVEVEENLKMLAYAIGVCGKHGWQPTTINLTIHQPRPFHPDGKSRPWTLTLDELIMWQGYIADQLRVITDELVTGDHCYKCPARAYCEAARRAGLNGIDVTYNVAIRDDMDEARLALELDQLTRAEDAIKTRLDAIRELAKYRLQSGALISDGRGNNWALEQSYGNRYVVPGTPPAVLAMLIGVPLDKISTTKLITPAQMEKLGANEDALKAFTKRPTTGVRLVRQNANKRGKKLFKQKE